MGWVSHNKFFVTGSVTSGLTLSINNADSGTAPADMSISTYDDYDYDASTYERTAIYEGTYESSFSVSDITWIVSASNNDIKYQYNESEDGILYDGWTVESDAIATMNIQINKPYFKIRFLFYSSYWTDTDSIYISTIQQYFKYFQDGEVIYANEMNENFKVVGAEDMMPRGGNGMVFTNSAYDLGSTAYEWNNIYVNNIDFTGELKGTWILITSTSLSGTATSIDVSDLSSYSSDQHWMMNFYLSINANTSGSFKLYFNQDSSNSYYYMNAYKNTRANGASTTGIELATKSGLNTLINVSFDGFLHMGSGQYKLLMGAGQYQYNTLTTSHKTYNGTWLDSSTAISSINFRAVSGGSFNPGSKINLYRRNS